MSLLYPLFLAGIAAVALPILLHMIRRHTRDRVAFSSLMFLRPTLPRFRSRSRLEHVLLLVLRCLVLCLLAFAFARPFLARPVATNAAGRLNRRVVLLIDTSASMRRAGLWTRALDEAKAVLSDAGPADGLCVMSFDQGARTLVGFEQWRTMDPGQRVPVTTREMARLAPGWAATDLGQALVAAAEAIEDEEIDDGTQAQRRIVLVSDLQQGSKLDALLAYEWPQRMELVVKAIPCEGPTNASLQLVANRDSLAPSQENDLPDIRVTNSPDATNDHFQLRWAAGAPVRQGGSSSEPQGQDGLATQGRDALATASRVMEVYVAAGHSTVVQAPARPNEPASATLVLTGDDQDFDNTLYVLPEPPRQVNVLYLGDDDPNDTGGMLYYLRQVFGTGRALACRVVARPGDAALDPAQVETAHLIVVADPSARQSRATLRRYLEAGRPILLVMKSAEAAAALSGLAGADRIESQEAEVARYAMLGRLEFDHPLLQPFSDPRFGDFTRIHFWRYRRLNAADCPGARVLARFDNDDPAWLEIPVGRGTLLVWTSGWQPADSDLALSSKFVPLLYGVLEYGGTLTERQSQYFVGDAVPIPTAMVSGTEDIRIRKPDGSVAPPDKVQQVFTGTDVPGIYSIMSSVPGGIAKASNLDDAHVAGILPAGAEGVPPSNRGPEALGTRGRDARDTNLVAAGSNPQSFAVNLSAAESRTDPMPVEELEKLGVSLQSTVAGGTSETARRAAYYNSLTEMESRQKLWRWVLVAVFVLLLIETWLGGWLSRPSPIAASASEGPAAGEQP